MVKMVKDAVINSTPIMNSHDAVSVKNTRNSSNRDEIAMSIARTADHARSQSGGFLMVRHHRGVPPRRTSGERGVGSAIFRNWPTCRSEVGKTVGGQFRKIADPTPVMAPISSRLAGIPA